MKVIAATGINEINEFIGRQLFVSEFDSADDLENLVILSAGGMADVIIVGNRFSKEIYEDKLLSYLKEKAEKIVFVINPQLEENIERVVSRLEKKKLKNIVLFSGDEKKDLNNLVLAVKEGKTHELNLESLNTYIGNKKNVENKNKGNFVEVIKLPEDYKKTVAVFSPETVGKTFTAVNLAYYFARRGIKTTLIDLDAEKKDVCFYLGQNFKNPGHFCMKDVADICSERLDGKVRDKFIKVNNNLFIYSDPMNMEYSINKKMIIEMTAAGRSLGSVVIIDAAKNFDKDLTSFTANLADEILFITDVSVGNIFRLSKYLNNMFGKLPSNSSLIVNNWLNGYVEKEEVEELLNNCTYDGEKYNFNEVFYLPSVFDAQFKAGIQGKPCISISEVLEKEIEKIALNVFPDERIKFQQGAIAKLKFGLKRILT